MIRIGHHKDLTELQKLFHETIYSICSKDYDDQQIKTWAAGADDKVRWNKMIKNQQLFVAMNGSKITGFCSLDQGNHIDLLFVHKDYQRKNIASQLYTHAEESALLRNQKSITADVSITAKPFFEKMGFTLIKEQKIMVKNVDFINFKMKKNLINDQ